MKKLIALITPIFTSIFAFSQSEIPPAKTYIYGKVKEDCPNMLFPDAGKIGEFKKGEILKISDNKGLCFKIITNERILYAKKIYFVNPDSLDIVYAKENGKTDSLNNEINKDRIKKENANIAANELIGRQKSQKMWEASVDKMQLGKLLSKQDISLVKQKKVQIGMSALALRFIEGEPNKINKTTTKYGVDEQWVYKNKYYYITNGKLSTIQESQ